MTLKFKPKLSSNFILKRSKTRKLMMKNDKNDGEIKTKGD